MTIPTLSSPLISATVLADSISNEGVRLTTFELVYPRMILAELNTHRVFSKNSASSRAIPFKRMVQMIRDNPALPASWRLDQSGMQGYEVASEELALQGQAIWLEAMDDAIRHSTRLAELGFHKQIVNRVTEPYHHMKTVLTGVYFENFFGLRDHHMADPTIAALAKTAKTAREASTPSLLFHGDWHLPYVRPGERDALGVEKAIKVSAARCARTSYNNMNGNRSSVEEDIKLHDRLLVDQPIHASPAEHQATPDVKASGKWANPQHHKNLGGWLQYRSFLTNENMDVLV